jgi:hypothetical protein
MILRHERKISRLKEKLKVAVKVANNRRDQRTTKRRRQPAWFSVVSTQNAEIGVGGGGGCVEHAKIWNEMVDGGIGGRMF